MRKLILLAFAGILAPAPSLPAQQVDLKEWPVEWGGRTRDPYVAPDGRVWFVGQAGNYIANFDPSTQAFRRYEIEEGTNPHNLIVDENGIVWYAGNRNGRIGRLDPATGEIKVFMTGEARDPHTLMFDGKGNIWFSSQGASRIGRLNMETGHVDVINPLDRNANPYGLVVDGQGRPWVSLFATNLIATVDPQTLQVKTYPTAEGGRTRRPALTGDGMVYYVDFTRGYVGRLDPSTGQTKEWLMPGGAQSQPYAITADDQGRLWIAETPRGGPNKLVGFDPKTERFFSSFEVSGAIRHMMFHKQTGTLWFGTDANNIGRAVVARAVMQ